MSRRTYALALVLLLICAAAPSAARADGDPGSDVLVFQNLFVGSDAGISITQQVQLGDLLQAAGRTGFPVRVAVIAGSDDLGALAALWRRPQAYARFLGIELALAYRQRLLVVMPNGFGFNWPGHSSAPSYAVLAKISINPSGSGLLEAAQNAVQALAAAASVKLSQPGQIRAVPAPALDASRSQRSASGRGTDDLVSIIVAALAAVAAVFLSARAMRRRRRRRSALAPPRRPIAPHLPRGRRPNAPHLPRRALSGLAFLLCAAAGGGLALVVVSASGRPQPPNPPFNLNLDPGTPLSGTAPDFTLSDQFGQTVSLHSFRGKVVILAFTDSECTTICPMTTTAILDAKSMLGSAGSRVQLLGIDADPAAISLEDVWSYSELHGMLRAWHFLTGSLIQLQRVWKSYAVEAAVEHGLITHTPALYVIGPQGQEAKVYITQQSYAAIPQLGKLLAQEASSLLPGRPAVHSNLSYAPIPVIGPRSSAVLERAGGDTIRLGPGRSPRLYLFFATWDQEITSLGGQLDALDQYASSASRADLPPLTAVDETSVEPTPQALTSFLDDLPWPLRYPVAIDRTGRVADGYEVQGVPWFVLVSPAGRILWSQEVSTSGWPTGRMLVADVRAALARAPAAPTTATAQALSGSPRPLAGLHQQAARLLGPASALAARVRALRGYPIVINAWASWCTPCRSEFSLFAAASARYGRRVAFLGADTDDSPADARSFLAEHPVSYPSYPATTSSLTSLAVIEGLPTTIFIDPAGNVVDVHTGQYDSEGTLDADIADYALPE